MRVKRVSIFALFILVLITLSACGEKLPEYPSLPVVDISEMELETMDFPVRFPAGEFACVCEANTLTLYPFDSYDSDERVSIEVRRAYRHSGPLTQEELDGAVEALRTFSPAVMFLTAEMRELDGEPVFYIEQSADQFKRASRRMDEDAAAMFDGRLAAESRLVIYMERDGTVYTYTGIYFTDEQKKSVLETISVLAQTTNR